MEDALKEIIVQIELLSVDGIRSCFERGLSPNTLYKDEPLLNELTSEYGRGSRFKECVNLFVEYGLEFKNRSLLSVLLDDSDALKELIKNDPLIVHSKHDLRCAYTPLYKASLLHVCAEFNHVNCAKILIDNGADINEMAGKDENGFGGQTPIFHTVNQNSNCSIDMLDFLLIHKVNLDITVKGLIWGNGYEWETLIPCVNPISYAMMGLLPQMHRNEITISNVVIKLLKHKYGTSYLPKNVPCKYLMN